MSLGNAPVVTPGWSRASVPLSGVVLRRDALRRFSRLPGLVVNLVSADGRPALLSEESLGLALRARPAVLDIDLLHEASFRALALAKVAAGLDLELALRRALCQQPVAALARDVETLVAYAGELQLLVDVYALQRHHPAVLRAQRALPRISRELREAAAVHADNVRCSDLLRYDLRPLLETLSAAFGH